MSELNFERRPKRIPFSDYIQRTSFRAGLVDAVQGKPWRSFADSNDELTYERARHFVAAWRAEPRSKAPILDERGRTAGWIAAAVVQMVKEGHVLN